MGFNFFFFFSFQLLGSQALSLIEIGCANARSITTKKGAKFPFNTPFELINTWQIYSAML
jgi:hypothetical protein